MKVPLLRQNSLGLDPGWGKIEKTHLYRARSYHLCHRMDRSNRQSPLHRSL